MRSPSGWHQSGMRGREPVAIRAASNVDPLGAVDRRRPRPSCGPTKRAVPRDHAHALALQQPGRAVLQVRLDPLDARRQRLGVDLGDGLLEAHPRRPAQEAHRPAGGDHRLRRDAVPEVGGAADHVALDHRHLGAETGGVRGRRVAGRAAADDEESGSHRPPRLWQLLRGPRPIHEQLEDSRTTPCNACALTWMSQDFGSGRGGVCGRRPRRASNALRIDACTNGTTTTMDESPRWRKTVTR